MSTGKGTINRVMVIGNFGANPELRTLPDGGSVTNFSVATTDVWTDKNNPGERREQTEWHRVTFFGRMAEILHEYGRKGAKVYVEGSLRTRKWTDKDGIERYATEIRGRDFTFLSPKSDDSNSFQQNQTQTQAAPSTDFNDMEDDIPF